MLGMPSIENQINTNNTESIGTKKTFPEYLYHGLCLPINKNVNDSYLRVICSYFNFQKFLISFLLPLLPNREE